MLNYNPCANDTLNFIDQSTTHNGGAIQTWQWQFADGTGSSAQSPVKKYAAFGDYSVSLHIITAIGCFGDTAKPISLSPTPVAAFGILGALFCPGATLGFVDSSTITSHYTITKWSWSFGDGSTSSQQNPTMQFAAAGTYTVILAAYSDHNCADTTQKTVTIFNNPTASLPTDLYIFAGTPYQLTPAYTGTGLTYLWAPPDALSSDTAAYPTTTTLQNITYKVTVTGNGGCQAEASVIIHVEKLIAVPNAFSPNGDGINDKWIITNIEGYPNCTVNIFNRYGQPVFTSVGYNIPWDGTLNGKPLPVGTYYYIIDTKTPMFPGKAGYVELLR
jgi:gliding motility-associated-like protein